MKTLTEFSGVILRQAAKIREDRRAAGLEGEAEALGAELGMSGDRLARLGEALDAAGDKLDSVRLVRVYEGESAPPRTVTVGTFHYLIDRISAGKAQERSPRGRSGGERRGGPDRKPRRPGSGRGADQDRGAERPRGPAQDRGTDRPRGPDRGEPSDQRRQRGPQRGDMPREGEGWTFTRAGREPEQERGADRDRDRDDRRKRRGPRRESAPRTGEAPRQDSGGERRPGRDHRSPPGGERRPGRDHRSPQGGEPQTIPGRQDEGRDQTRGADSSERDRQGARGGPEQPGAGGGRRRSRRRRRGPARPGQSLDGAGNAPAGSERAESQIDEPLTNGNQAQAPRPEINGNVAVVHDVDIDDDIGNR
jgi:23S rRNA pseudouridine2605 synthase